MSSAPPPATSPSRDRTGGPSSRLMRPINAVVERFIPSALVFALVLTFVVMVGALLLTDAGPNDVVRSWGEGLAGLLAFMTQMALILLLGYILANTGPMQSLLRRLGAIPKGRVAPYLFVAVITAISGLITWGLSLVVGALLSKEVARQYAARGERVHFPLLIAGGYTGMAIWHMGYSGSGPLTAATPGSFLEPYLGGEIVPITQTTFATWNIVTVVISLLVIGLTMALMAPKEGEQVTAMPVSDEEEAAPAAYEVQTPADRLDASRLLTLLPGLLLGWYLFLHFRDGGGLTLDVVNWSFLTLILLLVRHPFELIALTKAAASNVGEILLQFPLYAGIMGIMGGTGLIAVLSEWFVSISTAQTFPLLAFLSAGVVNFFVPSGGGQVAVQGPILLEAGDALGVAPEIAIMAIAYGDQWTNMIQPFWAIPLLAIAGLKLREILGYTTVLLFTLGVVFSGAMLYVGFFVV